MNRKAVEPLIVSFSSITLAAGLFSFPMIGCLALFFLPLALLSFLRFVALARIQESLPGLLALVFGFLVYGYGTIHLVLVFYARALAANRPTMPEGPLPQPLLYVGLILFGFVFFVFGLQSWAGLSTRSGATWGASMFVSAFLAVGVHLLVASFWPLSA